MTHTHTPAEWLAFLFLGFGAHAALSVPYFLLVEAEVWAWPRPLTAAADAARPTAQLIADRLLVELRRARHTPRELAVAAAALLMLATINPGDAR